MVLVALLIAAALAAFFALVVWRGLQFGALAREGTRATATVVRKFRTGAAGHTGSRGHRIAFSYRGPDGKEYRRAASLTRSRWQTFEVGHPIEIVLLPAKPGVSAPAWLVDEAREALRAAGKL
jgi:hypothetical protein